MNQSQWHGTSSQQQQIISYPQKLPRVPDWRRLAKPSPAGRGQLPNVHLQPDVGGDGVGGGGGGVGGVGGVLGYHPLLHNAVKMTRTRVDDCINRGSALFETMGELHVTKLEKQAEQGAAQAGWPLSARRSKVPH